MPGQLMSEIGPVTNCYVEAQSKIHTRREGQLCQTQVRCCQAERVMK